MGVCGKTLDNCIANCKWMSGKHVEEEEGRTVDPVQKGEKEEETHSRKKVQVEFPQEFLFIDSIFTLFQCGDVDLFSFSLFGHGWSGGRGQRRSTS